MVNKGLKREMTRLDLLMASLGGIIGSGWLFGALFASNVAGPSSIISWVIGGVAVLLIGLVFAELGAMLPEAGGIARYPQYSHGSFTSFIMGWGAWIAYASVPAIEAEAVVQYASHYVPSIYNPATGLIQGPGLVLAAALMLIFFLLNYFGVKLFAKTNTVVTTIKFIMPTLTIITFLIAGVHWSNLTSHGFATGGVSGMLQAVATSGIVFAYLGFRQAIDLAGESKNPQKDLPFAVIGSILIGAVLYVLLELVFVTGVAPAALAQGWSHLTFSAPVAEVATSLNLGWMAVLLYADAVISPAGTGNIYIASTTRVLLALAGNRYFPKALLKVDEKTGIPHIALWVAFILGLIFLLPFPAWQQLVGLVSSATVFTYMIGPVSAAALRRTHPDAKRPYKVGGLGIIAPIAFIVASLIIYWTGWKTDWKLLVALLVGVVLYLLASAIFPKEIERPSARSVKSGTWLVVYLVVMLFMSYAGSARFGAAANGGKGLIHYPLDLIVIIVLSLIFYYWGASSGTHSADTDEALQAIAIEAGDD